MGTTRAVLNHGPNHWLLGRGGSWILSIPAVTEHCENQETRAGIFLGLRMLEELMWCVCVDAYKCDIAMLSLLHTPGLWPSF